MTVTEYQFGKTVEVKLPEPNHRDRGSLIAAWSHDQVSPGGYRYTNPVARVKLGYAPLSAPISLEVGEVIHQTVIHLSRDDARALGSRLLAAADYAENGDQS